ncbi:hypothetical protein ACX0G9_04485 [Flavitalea flava]
MGLFRKITSLFNNPSEPTVSFTQAERTMMWQEKQRDLGDFTYEEDGFTFSFKDDPQKMLWAEIERLIAYKVDLMAVDEICMDIFWNGWQTTITEETPGWYQFVERTKVVFPDIPKNWDGEIMHPPFARNEMLLYQRNKGQ